MSYNFFRFHGPEGHGVALLYPRRLGKRQCSKFLLPTESACSKKEGEEGKARRPPLALCGLMAAMEPFVCPRAQQTGLCPPLKEGARGAQDGKSPLQQIESIVCLVSRFQRHPCSRHRFCKFSCSRVFSNTSRGCGFLFPRFNCRRLR